MPPRLFDATLSYGSFNTRLFDIDFNTGRFGEGGRSRLMFVVIGTAGVVILENGKVIANFLAEEAGWADDSAVLPDINENLVVELYSK